MKKIIIGVLCIVLAAAVVLGTGIASYNGAAEQFEGVLERIEPGADGAAGQSAYEVWLSLGNTGTESDFIASLKGPPGLDGSAADKGADGMDGIDGQSAYEVWLSLGNTGTEADFIASLKGPAGQDGQDGAAGADGADGSPGQSAYEVWLSLGNTGTEADFINSLKGPAGQDGAGAIYHHNIRFKVSSNALTFFSFDIYSARSAEYTSIQEFLSENAGRQFGVSGISLIEIQYMEFQPTGYLFISRLQISPNGENITLFVNPCDDLSSAPFILTLNWMNFPEQGSFATTVFPL